MFTMTTTDSLTRKITRRDTFATLVEVVAAVSANRENGDGSDSFDAFNPNGSPVTRGQARTVDVDAFYRSFRRSA